MSKPRRFNDGTVFVMPAVLLLALVFVGPLIWFFVQTLRRIGPPAEIIAYAWTIATLCDAYCGFLTFSAWVYYKERAPGRLAWFVLIMALGNVAMAAYMLRELARLKSGEPAHALLLRRGG